MTPIPAPEPALDYAALETAQAAGKAEFHKRYAGQGLLAIPAVITAALRAYLSAAPSPTETFQQRVDTWLIACFGETIARDKRERDHRLLEEALETVQSGQCTRSEAHQLVDYVFDRPVGELKQEVGGVMNTLAAWCLAYDIDLNEAAETELVRVWTKVDAIRAKQAAKPKHSPLPEATPSPAGTSEVGALVSALSLRSDPWSRDATAVLATLAARLAASQRMTQSAQRIIDRLEAENDTLVARVEAAEREAKEAKAELEFEQDRLIDADARATATEAALAGAVAALEQISELQFSEAAEPLDDAIEIARKVLRAADPSRLPPAEARSLKPGTSEASE